MAESPATFLLDKLSLWLQEEKHLLGGLTQEIQCIHDELGHMREFLRVADAREETDLNLKQWVRQVREITYDIEDVLEKYMFRFGRRDSNGRNNEFTRRLRRVYDSIRSLKARRRIAIEVQEIKTRVEDAARAQQRYKDMYTTTTHDYNSNYTVADNRLSAVARGDALLLQEEDVVGIDKSKKIILEWMISAASTSSSHRLQVISVVGMGGLGKTTLVKKLYDEAIMKMDLFEYHVWITVSETYTVKDLLRSMVRRLRTRDNEGINLQGLLEDMNVDDLRELLYNLLHHKSYIIVLDDVWNASVWEAIRYAFPRRDGSHGSVIITTRLYSVANAAGCGENENGHVYDLQPLSEKESRELFHRKAFPRTTCPYYLKEIFENILRRCAGLPLAIVVVGGLLATKGNRIEEWEMFSRSLGDEMEDDGMKRMSKLLSLSFHDLPYYLKSCFIYLSIFPEDYLIDKWKLIRLWIAEGFVQPKQKKTMEEVAEGYLNDLLNKSLIKIAKKTIDGRPKKFIIHDVLRQYIISKSREQNILADNVTGDDITWNYKTRHLSVNSSISRTLDTCTFEHLRSLHLLGFVDSESVEILNKVLEGGCKLLKVLDLRGAPIETIPTGVFKLYHLKYLSLRKTMIKSIPKSIQNLQKLETLDLKESKIVELPIEILKLRKLRHLLVYSHKVIYHYIPFDNLQSFKAPYEISQMSSLQKLLHIEADHENGVNILKEIGQLTQLRRLGITKLRQEDGSRLCSSLAKLINLRSLSITLVKGHKVDLQHSTPCLELPFLRKLVLHGHLASMPHWIASLNGLTTLILRWSKLRNDPLKYLKDLPNLSVLGMYFAYEGDELNFSAGGFEKLKKLWLLSLRKLKRVTIEEGAMRHLEELFMWDCKSMEWVPDGMEHLENLRYVEFCDMAEGFEAELDPRGSNQENQWKLKNVAKVCVFNLIDGAWRGRRLTYLLGAQRDSGKKAAN
ncbi:disease resistance protein RPM1 isoform X1 [Andrographis paniculata]|uniref:disease resistance protein RPM1 isoform X1 n=1 Tax=Andrographis paniculata TaxID=175694 RepID=UPI0021E7DC80|nr:disease resistance protein RPM1 isoform X1 [Andrographis paniculata]